MSKKNIDINEGEQMVALMEKLYPICRSITGEGVRKSLEVIQEIIPLEVHEIATGTKVFDWTVPKEWNINEAWLKDPDGNKVVDFGDSNLHLLNYSIPIDRKVTLDELKDHIFTLPEQPELIPYRTSYYNENWGFCMSHSKFENLSDGTYHAYIDSTLEKGSLTYGELYIEGENKDEVLISCHTCHPSLCNDNLSGISVATQLAKSLMMKKNRYSYRFLFIPGTIGSISWLASNKDKIKNIKHGLVCSNLGDPGKMNYKKSRRNDAEIDRVSQIILRDSGKPYGVIDFFPYGYDERQYCSPGFNLSVGCIMRSPHGQFPEYHTSADNFDLVQPRYLEASFLQVCNIVEALEANKNYRNTNPYCEPQLGKRGLYKHIGGADEEVDQLSLLWVLNKSDGRHSLIDIAEQSGIAFEEIKKASDLLQKYDLLEET